MTGGTAYPAGDPDRPDPRDVERFFVEDVERLVRDAAPPAPPDPMDFANDAVNLGFEYVCRGEPGEALRWFDMAAYHSGYLCAKQLRDDVAVLHDATLDHGLVQLADSADDDSKDAAAQRVESATRVVAEAVVTWARAYAQHIIDKAHTQAAHRTDLTPSPHHTGTRREEGNHGS